MKEHFTNSNSGENLPTVGRADRAIYQDDGTLKQMTDQKEKEWAGQYLSYHDRVKLKQAYVPAGIKRNSGVIKGAGTHLSKDE